MIKRLLTGLIVLLAGCAGVSEMREETPFASFSSSKSADALVACISEAWVMQERWPFTPDVRVNPIGSGKQVMIYNAHSMSPDAFVDVVDEAASTTLKFYSKNRRAFKQTFADLAEGCL